MIINNLTINNHTTLGLSIFTFFFLTRFIIKNIEFKNIYTRDGLFFFSNVQTEGIRNLTNITASNIKAERIGCFYILFPLNISIENFTCKNVELELISEGNYKDITFYYSGCFVIKTNLLGVFKDLRCQSVTISLNSSFTPKSYNSIFSGCLYSISNSQLSYSNFQCKDIKFSAIKNASSITTYVIVNSKEQSTIYKKLYLTDNALTGSFYITTSVNVEIDQSYFLRNSPNLYSSALKIISNTVLSLKNSFIKV